MTIIQFPNNEKLCDSDSGLKHTVTLPIAPRPFHRIRFDPIDPQTRAVPPKGALNWLIENLQQGAKIETVDIYGPGDPLCEIHPTMELLELMRRELPDIAISLTTLGLNANKIAKPLSAAGVLEVTLLVDAVERKVAEKLYAWIRPGKKTIPLTQAIVKLLSEQKRAAKAFKKEGCKITVQTTVYPGFNDDHIEEIAKVMAASGVDKMTLVPCKTLERHGDPFLNPPGMETMLYLQKYASRHLETHLSTEKKKIIGTDCSSLHGECKAVSSLQPKPTKNRPNVAVVSSNGMEVDIHLGQAYQVLIYGPREDGLPCLLETRSVPEPGSGGSRWKELAEVLSDCFAVLATSAGESPRRILGDHGITVLITDNEIEGTVDVLYGGDKKRKKSC